MRIVAVVGPGTSGDELSAAAREVGRLLAEAGCVVVTGGLGGVMEEASRGAAEAGGLVVGILPGRSSADANPYVRVPIATGLGEARNAIVAQAAHAVVAVGGAYGTLSEIALARKLGKRVVSLGSWEVDDSILSASSPAEAVALVTRA